MTVKLLTEYHLEFLSLKGCCTGLSESKFVKMSNCWKSHAAAHIMKERRGDFFSLREVIILNTIGITARFGRLHLTCVDIH